MINCYMHQCFRCALQTIEFHCSRLAASKQRDSLRPFAYAPERVRR